MEYTDPQLPSVEHFRDVGKCINHIANRKLLKEGLLYISSSITDASSAENEYLRNTLGIRTVVDTTYESTRTRTPASEVPNPKGPQTWLDPTSILGLTYCGLKWRRGPYITQVLSELSMWQQWKWVGNAIFEDQVRVNVLLMDVATRAGATNESLRVLDASRVMIGELWNKMFGEEASYPILMIGNRDCSIFLIALLLFLKVPVNVMSREVEQSIVHVQSVAEKPTDESSLSFLADFVQSAGTWVGDVKQWLEEKHHGIEGYLKAADVTSTAQETVKSMLLANADEKLVEL